MDLHVGQRVEQGVRRGTVTLCGEREVLVEWDDQSREIVPAADLRQLP